MKKIRTFAAMGCSAIVLVGCASPSPSPVTVTVQATPTVETSIVPRLEPISPVSRAGEYCGPDHHSNDRRPRCHDGTSGHVHGRR